MRVPAALVLILVLAVGATAVHAQCTDPKTGKDVKKSIRLATRCNDRTLKAGAGATCTASPPPACAGTLATDAVALGYGPNNFPPNPPPATGVDGKALANQLRCQKRIGRAIASYVGRKLVGLQKGTAAADAQLRARRQLDRLPDKCAVTVAADVNGVVLPAVGPQCAAAVGQPGDVVDAARLRDCLLTLLGVWVDRFGPNPQPLRPNILFILSDDQRWDTTDGTHGLGGAPVMARTRAELAARGLEFPEAFMTTPLCCPSRASILTGSYAHRTGVYKNNGTNGGADDFEDASCIATWLEAAGYRTSLIGKYLNGYANLWIDGDPPHVPPGWTEWRGLKTVKFFDYTFVEPDGLGGYVENLYGSAPEDYLTDVMREKAKTFISASVAADAPFFLYLSFKAPHLPQIPAPRHEGLFQGIPPWRPPSYNEPDVSDKPSWLQNTPQLDAQEQADLDQVRIDQLEMLQAVDEAIGGNPGLGITGIMEHLRALGIEENTLVVYFADNGWHWGEHRTRAKNKPYEESIRSPMMVHYPKLAPAPRVDTRFALNIDLAPTFAELAGASVPIVHDGMSLLRVFDGTQPTWRTDFLTEGWPNLNRVWATVREGQWKYTEIPVTPGDANTTFELELYDLLADPYELDNVAGDPQHATRIARMALRLRELRPNWPIDSDFNANDPPEDDE